MGFDGFPPFGAGRSPGRFRFMALSFYFFGSNATCLLFNYETCFFFD